MKFACIALGLLSLPATFILSNLFWMSLREARGIAMLLSNQELLRHVLTPDILNDPPAEVARFAQPVAGGYSSNMQAFGQSHSAAHSRGRALLRIVLVAVVIGSGIAGFLGIGRPGLALPIVNTLIVYATFMGSRQGSIDSTAMDRATEHVRIVAVILQRWHAESPRDAAEWLRGEPQLKPLWEVLASLRTR